MRQANAGKAVALNAGIAHARHDIVVMIDGDTVFEPDTVRTARAALRGPVGRGGRGQRQDREPRRASSGGCSTSSTSSGSTSTGGCRTSSAAIATIPGAVGAFRRRALLRGRRDVSDRHPRRGHRPHDRAGPGRVARGLRGHGPRLDRGARHARASCGGSATAGATAPCSRCGSTAAPCVERGLAGQLGRVGLVHVAAVPDRSFRCSRRWSTSSSSTACVFLDPVARDRAGAGDAGGPAAARAVRVPAGARADRRAVAVARCSRSSTGS